MIRPIEKNDNLKMKEIIQRSLEKHKLNLPGTAYYDPQLGYLTEYYRSLPHANYWVYEINGLVIGGIGIAPFSTEERICELQKFYIDDQALGNGYGKQLIEHALNFAKNHYSAVYLETMHHLEVACRLYEKYDFELLKQPIPGSEHSLMDAWYIKTFD